MVTATKGLTIHRSTNVLTLVLKRFDIFTGGKITKVTGALLSSLCRSKEDTCVLEQNVTLACCLFGLQDVRYPEYLDLYPFMSETQGKPLVYRLYAVLVHYGRNSHSGHYFCYIKVLGLLSITSAFI